MLSYCLKCRKNTESKNPKLLRTKIGRILLTECAVCHSKKSRFKGQEASSLLSSMKMNTPLTTILLVDPVVLRVINKLMQITKWMKQ